MAVQAVDAHFLHVDVVRKLEGLRDHGPEREVAVAGLAADGAALMKSLARRDETAEDKGNHQGRA